MDSDFERYFCAVPNNEDNEKVSDTNNKFNDDTLRSIVDLERHIGREKEKIKKFTIYNELLSMCEKNSLNTISNIKNLAKKINNVAKNERTRQKTNSKDDASCANQIKKICNTIQSNTKKEYLSLIGLVDQCYGVTANKQVIWNDIENVVSNFTPPEIAQALVHNINKSNNDLKEKCNQVDVTNDAAQLKFQYEQGILNDISEQPQMLQTVSDLIENQQISHFKKFLKKTEVDNQTYKVKKYIEKINKEIKFLIDSKMDKEAGKYLLTLYNYQQEYNALVSMSEYLSNEIFNLSKCISDKEESIKNLEKKFNQIHSFEEVTRLKQKMIQKLIQTNSSYKSHHLTQHKEILTVIDHKIIQVEKLIQELCIEYRKRFNMDIKHSLKIPISKLQCVKSSNNEDGKNLISDLTLYRLDSEYSLPGQEVINKFMNLNNIAPFISPDKILEHLKEASNYAYETSLRLKGNENISDHLIHSSKVVSNVLDDLKDASIRNDNPGSLKRNQTISQSILSNAVQFQKASDIWWYQPAQKLVPWLKEDELNLQGHIDKYNELAARLPKI